MKKLPPSEIQDLMTLYRKITGKRIIDQSDPEMVLENTYQAVQEYEKKKASKVYV